MKAIKILTMAALATAVFASCSNDEDLAQSNYPMDNVVRIMTSVDGMNTRASYGNSTDKLSSFGFCINNAGSDKYTYDNIKVTKEGSNWIPATQMLWQNSTTAVDILAYAPYQETTEDAKGKVKVFGKTDYAFSVKEDQSNAEDYSSDLIVYKKKGFVPGTDLTNGAVDITFTHALSLLNIKIVFGTEFNNTTPLASNPITNIKIGGSINKGYADLSANPITVAADKTCEPVMIEPESGEFTAATNIYANATANYSAILIPQTIEDGFRVEFEIDGKIYVWRAPESVIAKLEAGKKHQLTLTVGKDLVKAGSMTASPWVEGTGATLETE